MMQLRPTPDQERWLVIASRLGEQADAHFLDPRAGGWRRSSLLVRCASFLLGFIASCILSGIVWLITHSEHTLLITGPLLIAIAEWRIAREKLFASGFEEALEVIGLLMVAVQLHGDLESSTTPGGDLLIAGALAIAGLRLLNPLFTTAATVVVSFALAAQIGSHAPTASLAVDAQSAAAAWASAFCYAVALLALGFGALRFRRPAHDRILDWLVLAMPLAGYLWCGGRHYLIDYIDRHVDASHPILISLAALAYGLVALTVGITRRTHAPLIAFMISVACAAVEIHKLSGLPTEVRLIVSGVALLIIAVTLNRYLRTPRKGITSEPMSNRQGSESLLQLVGSVALTPHSQARDGVQDADGGFRPAGGEFGGGGASGSY